MSLKEDVMDFVESYWKEYCTEAGYEDQDLLGVNGPLDEPYKRLVKAVLREMDRPRQSADTSSTEPTRG